MSTIRTSFSGRSPVPTRAKAIVLRGYVVAERIKFATHIETFDLLPRYPHDLDQSEVQRVESFVRVSFGSLMELSEHEEEEPAAIKWAQTFWRANWSIYPCRLAGSQEQREDEAAIQRARVDRGGGR